MGNYAVTAGRMVPHNMVPHNMVTTHLNLTAIE